MGPGTEDTTGAEEGVETGKALSVSWVETSAAASG